MTTKPQRVNARALRANLSEYLRLACEGAQIIVTWNGLDFAVLGPVPQPSEKKEPKK